MVKFKSSISKYILLMLILAGCLLTSCTVRYKIIPSKKMKIVGDNTAIVKIDDLEFTFTKKYWSGEPSSINSYYQCFYVRVKNRSGETKKILADDFILLDQENIQYDIVSPDQIIEMLEITSQDKFVTREVKKLSDLQQEKEELMEAKANVISKSFRFGKLVRNASKKGYIFFDNFSERQDSFTFRIKDKDIIFNRVKKK